MEIVTPRPKKISKHFLKNYIPSIQNERNQITGYFNGHSVIVEDLKDIQTLQSMGYFGKCNFSRSYSFHDDDKPEILRSRQYKKRAEWTKKFQTTQAPKKILVVPDSDDEYDNYFEDLIPKYEIDKSGISEVISLSLEETFFIAYCTKLLKVTNISTQEEMWNLFSSTDPYFPCNYATYYYFRSKNWVVKPGLKFGGDFLLYKQGPPFYHASYVVIIDVFDENHKRIENLNRRSMDNMSILCLNRLCETAGKELLICKLTLNSEQKVNFENLEKLIIEEILASRWSER